MSDPKQTWNDVASKVESLGLKLKLHLDQERDDQVADRAEGETSNAFDELSGRVADAFDAFGNAAKDDAVQDDMRELAELIKQALIETLRAAGAEIEQLMDQIEDYAEDAAERMAEAAGIGDDADRPDELPRSSVQDTVSDAT